MPRIFSLHRAGPLLLSFLAVLAGCEEEPIHQYRAPKAEAPEKVRLIGVLYPHSDLTWVFKLTGPESAVKAQEDVFRDFRNSLHFADKGDHPLEWKLPDGWQPVAEAKAPPERYATLRIEAKGVPTLELTVTKFPGAVGGLLANVNRWRNQIGLQPVGQADLESVAKQEKINGDPVTVVDMVGPGTKATTSGAPFMNLPGAAPDKTPFHYTKPDGWEEIADSGGPIVRAAAFKAKDGDQTAEITVTPLPGDAGGLLQNVNRWRGQVKLDPINEQQLSASPKVEVGGQSVPFIDTGAGVGGQRIVGADIESGGQHWFFKMTGPSVLVEKEKARFMDFLKSAKFDAGKGGDQ